MTTSERPAAPAASTDTAPTSDPPSTRQVAGAVPKMSPQRAKVFEHMTATPHATPKECAAATGMPVGAVRQQQGHLRSAGLIPGRVVRKPGPQRAKVFQFMSANPRATAKECAAATGLSFSCARQHQFGLRTAGLIPLAPHGVREVDRARWFVAHHGSQCERTRAELEAIAARDGSLPSLLEPALRRRQRTKLRRLRARLHHHESRLAALLEILREGFAP